MWREIIKYRFSLSFIYCIIYFPLSRCTLIFWSTRWFLLDMTWFPPTEYIHLYFGAWKFTPSILSLHQTHQRWTRKQSHRAGRPVEEMGRTLKNFWAAATVRLCGHSRSPVQVGHRKSSKEEIPRAIWKQQNGKAPGPVGILAELLKADIITSSQMLYEIFEWVWEEETIPDDWKEDHLVKIPKRET